MPATIRSIDSQIAPILRVSITGECDLNCFYCKPLGRSQDLFEPKTLIQPSDVSKLVKIVGEMGVKNVIIQGGEPLLRKDAANFIKAAHAHKNIQEVRLVTNGNFLKPFADPLRKMGLRKVDVNFDSLNFMKYQRITGKDSLYRVLDGVEKVEKLNYSSIRLNIFLLNSINQDEVVEFARMTKDRKLHIRFIEYHPVENNSDPYAEKLGLSVIGVKRAIDNYQSLLRVHDLSEDIPMPTFQFAGSLGKISFLSKMEIDAENAIPRVLFNAEGVFSNEMASDRPQAILMDLRRDAKETRLHRTIEKVLTAHAVKKEPKKPKKAVRRAVSSSSRGRARRTQAAARR